MDVQSERFYVSAGSGIKSRYLKISLWLGILGLAGGVIGYFVDSHRFFYSYLTAFGFWVTIGLGGLFFVMLHHLTGATWSVVIRRQAETIMAVLPYLAIFFIIVLLGMKDLYHWTHMDLVAEDHLLQHKSPYLNIGFFVVRAVVYFAVWIFLALSLYRISLKQDSGHSGELTSKMKKISAPGMIIFAVSVTYAAFDWFMSQDPHWYSTIFGVYIFAGGLVSILAFLTIISLTLRNRGILSGSITEEHYHDLGKLMFAFMVFWAYVAFSQYFLIWYANIPEETIWFHNRYQGSWKYVTLLIAFGYFVVPFILLISRGTKRNFKFMRVMAIWLLFMHWVDLYWIVMPNFNALSSMVSWMDISAMVGIGGIFMWLFWRKFFAGAMVPVNDPRLESSIKFINY